jgi:hypothetical protein
MRYLASFLLLGASCCSLVAQNTAGTGSITGLVTDSTDSVIPGGNRHRRESFEGVSAAS